VPRDTVENEIPELAVARLVYVSDSDPGISRRRAGRHFTYRDPDGRIIRDPAVLARIRSLVIPPAYTQVWICTKPNGHPQATGRDKRGRKQYRYHARWREVRDEAKFSRMAALGDLGNTPAVCRKNYIHPAIVQAYAEGELDPALARPKSDHLAAEAAVLTFLECRQGVSAR
jgi:DNA topoisomerase IB